MDKKSGNKCSSIAIFFIAIAAIAVLVTVLVFAFGNMNSRDNSTTTTLEAEDDLTENVTDINSTTTPEEENASTGNTIDSNSIAMLEAEDAYADYMTDNNGAAPEFMVYRSGEGFIALHNGAAADVFDQVEDALKAILDDPNTEADESNRYYTKDIDGSNLMSCIKQYAARPADGKELFEYHISDDAGEDIASIHLPITYAEEGMPTKLVILNHGAGGDYTESEAYSLNYTLLNAGYATLHVRGVPTNYRNEKYIGNGYKAPYGSPVFIESVAAAYDYVVDKYNIAADGCAVYGASCGGLQTVNLVNAQVLPVKAVILDAPVIDLHHDCYFGGGWVTGSLGGQTAAGVAWMHQFDHCDFEAGTYTIGDATYHFSALDRDSLEELWQLNKEKVEPYNAYTAGAYLTESGAYAIDFAAPVKMWFGLSESTNNVNTGMDFIQRCKNGGCIAEFIGYDTSRHCVQEFDECRSEMLAWIEQYLPI